MRTSRAVWAALIVVLAPNTAAPQAATGAKFHPDASHTAETLLRNAASHARDRQWAEAVEIYQRVISQFGDTVAQVPKDDPAADPSGESRLYVDARQHCQRRLAALPPEGREIYRRRVDAQASRWFEQGATSRDRTMLRQVIEEAFCSSWGDDALERLGDLAFQDGQFAEALSAYRQLVPDQPDEPLGLVHPDPDVDLARVAAKKLLCRAALGDDPPGPDDLKSFSAAYPNASGPLAGRDGPLARSVEAALEADGLPLPAQPDGRWPTFAGAATRTKVAPGVIDVGSLQWKVTLPAVPQGPNNFGRPRPASPGADRELAYHPIVLGDQVIVGDENRMAAYHLNARPESPQVSGTIGDGVFAWDQKLRSNSFVGTARSSQLLPRYTLTASGDRIYARLGPAGGGLGGASLLIAVRNNREVEGKRLWERPSTEVEIPRRKPGDATGRRALFEGAPVADTRHVYIGLTETGTMTSNYVACLDADTGATRWVRYLGDANPAVDAVNLGMGIPMTGDLGGRLLSLDGPTVYYQTNQGAVAALDAETGQIRWLATYPHRERARDAMGEPPARARDLTPAIVHDGLVIVAPDDSPWLYAFDASTGRLAWKSDRALPDVAHVLGVAKGRLIVTGDRVWSLDAKTGKILAYWPDGATGLDGQGRGLLAGDHIYWPTQNEIQVLDQATGLQSDRGPIPLRQAFGMRGGNLAVGDGYLIVAGTDPGGVPTLAVFCQNRRLIERYREEIARDPARAATHLRLARVAEATGQDDLALEALAGAVAHARPSETFDGQPLGELARDARYRLLMKLGTRAFAAREWGQAGPRFAAAADAARLDKDRLAARLRLAEAQAAGDNPRGAVESLQAILLDARLRPLTVVADPSQTRTVRADLLVSDRLAELIEAKGRDLYADQDRAARDLFDRGKVQKEPRLLEEIGRTYPVADVAPAALLELGAQHAAAGRHDQAARAYKRLLAIAPSEALRARALWGLGQAHEARRHWLSAREAYARALARHATIRVNEAGPDATIGSLVAERLARAPFDRLVGDLTEPALPVPLSRRWDLRLTGQARPLTAEGLPPSSEVGLIFLAEGTTVRPVDPSSGRSAWSADLGGPPAWVAYLADRVLAATTTRLVALDVADGRPCWSFPADESATARRAPNPFAKPEAGATRRVAEPAPLSGFRVVGGHVYCRRGDRELIALDGDTGLVDWSYGPASGKLGDHAWIGPRRAVLQVRQPNAIVVLETDRGRPRVFAQGPYDEAWPRDPLPIDDDHVALAVDPQRVALLDLERGVLTWTDRDNPVLPTIDAPRLLGDSGRLFALYGGDHLVRLDPTSGRRLWPRPLSLDGPGADLAGLVMDADRLYCATGTTLAAYSLADGSPVWQRHLSGPTEGWGLALTERCVAAYPRVKTPSDFDALPLVFCRRDNGALVQRLLFRSDPTDLAVRLAPRASLVATKGGVWALGEDKNVRTK